MKVYVLLSVFLLTSCLVITARCGEADDDEVEVEVEGEEGGADAEAATNNESLTEPPADIEWKALKTVKKCRSKVTNDDTVGVHLVGKLASDDSIFYDSRENNPKDEWLSFPLGVGESIKGLELGILGMCKDEIRQVVVEPEMVKNGRHTFDPKDGKIPRGEKLIFEVEMMMMGPNYIKGLPNMFKVYDINKDELLTPNEIAAYLIDEGQFGPAGPLIDKLAKEVIDRDDRNRDGSVQWTEFSGPKHDEL